MFHDMLVCEPGRRRVQGTENETLRAPQHDTRYSNDCFHVVQLLPAPDMFHDMFVFTMWLRIGHRSSIFVRSVLVRTWI